MANRASIERNVLTVKDLVATGIFSALLFVAVMIGGIPFASNPVTTFYMPLGSALLGGPVFLLIVVAAFSGWVGTKLLRKQFEKAGITA